jgi:hypothetical protein
LHSFRTMLKIKHLTEIPGSITEIQFSNCSSFRQSSSSLLLLFQNAGGFYRWIQKLFRVLKRSSLSESIFKLSGGQVKTFCLLIIFPHMFESREYSCGFAFKHLHNKITDAALLSRVVPSFSFEVWHSWTLFWKSVT